jgi:hypothetical protein
MLPLQDEDRLVRLMVDVKDSLVHYIPRHIYLRSVLVVTTASASVVLVPTSPSVPITIEVSRASILMAKIDPIQHTTTVLNQVCVHFIGFLGCIY